MLRYLTLTYVKKLKNKKDVRLGCDFGFLNLGFTASNWELGFDFFTEFRDFHVEYYDKEPFQGQVLNTYIYLSQKLEKWKERKTKGESGINPTPSTLCNVCKHRISYNTCHAFLNGIPDDLHNKVHLTKHISQTNDIVFELGEEGSRSANIPLLKDLVVIYISYDNEDNKFYSDIMDGLIEERYGEEQYEIESLEKRNKMLRYLTLTYVKKLKNKIDVRLGCDFGLLSLGFTAPNWELSFDFFTEFRDFYIKCYDKEPLKDQVLNTYIYLSQKLEKWKERKAKGEPGVKTTPSILCNVCKHRISYNTCHAFPNGIPNSLHNDLHFTKHILQTNNVVFELGEEGSKNANIPPLMDFIVYDSYDTPYHKVLPSMVNDLGEERYGEER